MAEIPPIDLASMQFKPTGRAMLYQDDTYKQYEVEHIVEVVQAEGLRVLNNVRVRNLDYKAAVVGFHADGVISIGLHTTLDDTELVFVVLKEDGGRFLKEDLTS